MKELIKTSQDQKIIDSLSILISSLSETSCEYMIFGSCGIQAHLSSFYRLPNDIDVVVKREKIDDLLEYFRNEQIQYTAENGRYKAFIKKFPIHLIPETFSLINDLDKSVFYEIDLSMFFDSLQKKTIRLIGSPDSIDIKTLPIEIGLIMELTKGVNLNSLYCLYNVLEEINVDIDLFVKLTIRFSRLTPVIIERIEEYIEIASKNKLVSIDTQTLIRNLQSMLERFQLEHSS